MASSNSYVTNLKLLSIFVFPFNYQKLIPNKKSVNISPTDAANILTGGNTDFTKGWCIENFSFDSNIKYNEYFYFHPFIRKAVFSSPNRDQMKYIKREDFNRMVFFYPVIEKNIDYSIKDIEVRKIESEVVSIDLHLFDNQVGLLSITTKIFKENLPKSKNILNDLFLFNDAVRRIYPPYLSRLSNKVRDEMLNILKTKDQTEELKLIKNVIEANTNTAALKIDSQILPLSIILNNTSDKSCDIREDFECPGLPNGEQYLSNIIKKLLSPFLYSQSNVHPPQNNHTVKYSSYTDDRMFIISHLMDDNFSNKMKREVCGRYIYEHSEDWYKFVFVDGISKGIQNDKMMADLIKKHSYTRWRQYSTFIGFSHYSLVMLTNEMDYSREILNANVSSMYYQMAIIVLFQRLMLLKYADDIDIITSKMVPGKSFKKEIRNNVEELNRQFIKFINQYWYTDVTPQEQGIEMYEQWMEISGVKKLFDHVQRSINDLAGYIEDRTEAQSNSRISKITFIGLPLAIFGLIMNVWVIFVNNVVTTGDKYIIKDDSPVIVFFNWLFHYSLLKFIFIPFEWTISRLPVLNEIYLNQWSFKYLIDIGIVIFITALFLRFKFVSILIDDSIDVFNHSKTIILSITIKISNSFKRIKPQNTTIICPTNDGESRTIIDIAKKLGYDVRISSQKWGAVLTDEPVDIFNNLSKNVIIIEIPGVEKEKELLRNHHLFVIDHHSYKDLNRYKDESSLEQFSKLINYKLNKWETGIALNDRGFIHALVSKGYSEDEIKKIRKFDLAQQGISKQEFIILDSDYAKGSFINNNQLYLVETKCKLNSYLSDLHFWKYENNETGMPGLIVVLLNNEDKMIKISFNGNPAIAKLLFHENGGFCGGDETCSMYWGKVFEVPLNKEDALNYFLTIN